MQISRSVSPQQLAVQPAARPWWIGFSRMLLRFWPQIVMVAIIVLYLTPIFASGQIVFSDLAFGVSSQRYLSQIIGIWNYHWNTPNLFNLPRLIYVLPFYLFSIPFGFSGEVLLKSLIVGVTVVSAFSFHILAGGILRTFYKQPRTTVTTQVILIAGSLLYALNPWAIMRIQHIFLLCGYSLLPLVIYYFLRIFHPRFRALLQADAEASSSYRVIILDIAIFALLYSTMAASIHFAIYSVFVLGAMGILILAFELLRLREPAPAAASPRFLRVAIILTVFTSFLLPIPLVILTIVTLVGLTRLNKRQRWFLGSTALKAFGVIVAIGATCFYWFAPYALSVAHDVLPSQLNVNTVETIQLFSQHSSLGNVLYGNSYWWPMFDYASLPVTYFIGGGALLFTALLALRLRPRRYSLSLAAVGLPLVLIATGTHYPVLDQLYPQLVLGGVIPFGNMLRDPDKLVGLWMLVLSLLFVLGAHYLTGTLLQAKQRVITSIAYVFCLVLFLSLAYYLAPFRTIYMQGFYQPVQLPADYLQAETFLADHVPPDARILYLPTSENMVNPVYGYATPAWNLAAVNGLIPRATNEFPVFNTSYDTLFYQEGNPPFVEYYFNYLQYALDHGVSNHLGELLAVSGADYVVYYSDYLAQEARQDLNLEVLAMQPDLRLVFQNPSVSVYAIENPLPEVFLLPRRVFTPYGLDRLERYAAFGDFDFSRYGVMFTSADTLPVWESFSPGDYVEVTRFDDLLLSTLPAEYYLAPFDAIQGGSAWLKTYAQNQDWRWQLEAHQLEGASFDLDFGMGIVFTDAPARIETPERSAEPIGPSLITFQPGEDTIPLLISSNPDLLSITVEQTDTGAALRGQLAPSASAGTWYTARSDLLDVAESTPYRFYATLSGTNTRETHFKIHYYDADYREIGVEYILGTQALGVFAEDRFEALFVTPAGTRSIQIRLLVQPAVPGTEAVWWLHHLRLEDLSAYRQPNTFELTLSREAPLQGSLYARLFFSPAGGTVTFDLNGVNMPINTMTEGPQGFRWVKIAEITTVESGNALIQVNNVAGFNAVNVLAFVPDDELTRLTNALYNRLGEARIFMMLEAESDFTYSGTAQSAFTYPSLSSGQGVRSQDGVLESALEIVSAGSYTIQVRCALPANPAGSITVDLLDTTGAVILENQLSSANTPPMPGGLTNVMIPDITTALPTVAQVQSRVATMQNIHLSPIYLEPGAYVLRIRFDSQAQPLAGVGSFTPLSQQSGILVSQNAGVLQAIYPPSDADNWQVLTTQSIALNAQSPIFASLALRSEAVRDRHIKVKFFDAELNELEVIYFDEIDELLQDEWHTYSRSLWPPANAQYMQVQVLARAPRSEVGLAEIAGVELWQTEALALVDMVTIYETDMADLWSESNDPEELAPIDLGLFGRRINFLSDAPGDQFVVLPETYSPLWRNSSDSRLVLPFNGLLSMVQIGDDQSSLVFLDLNLIYAIGLLALIGFALAAGVYALVVYRPKANRRSIR